MHLVNAAAWTVFGVALVNFWSDRMWLVAIVLASLNIAWDLLKRKPLGDSVVELKNLPREDGWEVASEVKDNEHWYSVVRFGKKRFLVRSRQKLPKRFTTSEPVAVAVAE